MGADFQGATFSRLCIRTFCVKEYDLIVIGAGPAGSSCAALCAQKGKRVLLLDSSRFPRDKVCGDCLNPAVWPVLDLLGVSSRIQGLPSSSPSIIRFSVTSHPSVEFPLPQNMGEIVIRRREFDAILVTRAQELGVVFQDGIPITSLQKSKSHWLVTSSHGLVGYASQIVAADGRNSTIARYLRMLSNPLRDDRIGFQTHIPHPAGYDGALEMHFYRHGYGGMADLGQGLANLCLVSNAGAMRELRREAETRYQVSSAIAWRSISPITRPHARRVAQDGVFLVGDAACVVEPFTGQGISFAINTGAALAEILSAPRESIPGEMEQIYTAAHRKIYRDQLTVNRMMRILSQYPKIAHGLLPQILKQKSLLYYLTNKVMQHPLL